MELKKFIDKFAIKPNMPFERVVVFIDGAYLRKRCKDFGGHDNIEWSKLSRTFIRMFNTYGTNPFNANLIRIYFYDAIVPETDPYYKTQDKYFQRISGNYAFTVRLGTLKKSYGKRYRQKGVDILMAIDALTKAYQNQYDTGMFLLGDADFKPLIEAVKNAGKKTLGRSIIDRLARKTCQIVSIGVSGLVRKTLRISWKLNPKQIYGSELS